MHIITALTFLQTRRSSPRLLRQGVIGHFQTLGVKNLQWAGNALPQGGEKQETDW